MMSDHKTFASVLLVLFFNIYIFLFQQLAIADCGGIEALIEILQETEKTEVGRPAMMRLILFLQTSF